MFGSIFDAFGDFISTYAGNDESQRGRALAAYRDAFRERQVGDESLEPLVRQMKSHGVAGAYTDALQRPELTPLFTAWAENLPPEVVRQRAQQQRRSANHWPTLRRRSK